MKNECSDGKIMQSQNCEPRAFRSRLHSTSVLVNEHWKHSVKGVSFVSNDLLSKKMLVILA